MQTPTYMMGILQVRAYRVLQAYVQQTLSNFDLNSTQWSILGLISEFTDGMRVMDIAERLGVEAPLITMLSRPLLKRQLLSKIQPEDDNRARLLKPTHAGLEMVQNVEEVLLRQLKKLVNGVSPDEMGSYQKVLETILSNANVMEPIYSADAVKSAKGGG